MAWLWIEKNHLSRKYNIICQFKYLIDSNYTKFIICAPIFCSKRLFSSECWANYSNLFSRIILLTLHNDDAVGAVWAQPVAGHALVLAAVAGLAVDDLDGDHAVRVRDREQVRRQRLAGLRRYVDKYSDNYIYNLQYRNTGNGNVPLQNNDCRTLYLSTTKGPKWWLL